jgi:hypothetical protein
MTTTEDLQEGMERRVKLLLDRAKDLRSRGDDGEADSTLANAERIIIKYGIDAAKLAIQSSFAEREPIESEWVAFTGIYRVALAVRFNQLATAYHTSGRSFTVKDGTTEYVVLVGAKSEIRYLKMLMASLLMQGMTAMRDWWDDFEDRPRLPGMAGYKARRQFLMNFVIGAQNRIEESRRVALGTDESTTLALAHRRADVDVYLEENFNLRTVKTRLKPGVRSAAEAGYDAGRRADVGDTQLDTERRQITS